MGIEQFQGTLVLPGVDVNLRQRHLGGESQPWRTGTLVVKKRFGERCLRFVVPAGEAVCVSEVPGDAQYQVLDAGGFGQSEGPTG